MRKRSRKSYEEIKNTVLTKCLNKWEKIYKKYFNKSIDASCYHTSYAFSEAINSLNIIPKTQVIPVHLFIANADIFKDDAIEKIQQMKKVGREKYLKNLDNPYTISVGNPNISDNDIIKTTGGRILPKNERMNAHFVIVIPKNKEIIDLTIGNIERPERGIYCKNHWSKWDFLKKTNSGHKAFMGEDLIRNSIAWYEIIEGKMSIGIDIKSLNKATNELKDYFKIIFK